MRHSLLFLAFLTASHALADGDQATGERLFRHDCAACHTAEEALGHLTPGTPGMSLEDRLRAFLPMHVSVSEARIDDLVAYLLAVEAAQ